MNPTPMPLHDQLRAERRARFEAEAEARRLELDPNR
jgi:hypothetical protein